MYIQVNIGRNIDNNPMPDEVWAEFKGRVAFAIYNAANCWEAFDVISDVELHDGRGSYEGISEDSAHISSYWEDGFDLDQLRAELSDIKVRFGQIAVGFIVGSELV